MLKVCISPPIVKKTVSVKFCKHPASHIPKAVLIGPSGEKLKAFTLTNDVNMLSLDGFAAGSYTLRIEAGNEVVVKQIYIPG